MIVYMGIYVGQQEKEVKPEKAVCWRMRGEERSRGRDKISRAKGGKS